MSRSRRLPFERISSIRSLPGVKPPVWTRRSPIRLLLRCANRRSLSAAVVVSRPVEGYAVLLLRYRGVMRRCIQIRSCPSLLLVTMAMP